MSRREVVRRNGSVVAVVAIVFVASAFLLLRPAPEQVAAVSSDGMLRASGLASSGAMLTVSRMDEVQTGIPEPTGPVYELSLTGAGSLKNWEVVISIPQSAGPLSQVAIYSFDRTTLAWVMLPTLFHLSNSTVSSTLSFTGSMLLGVGARTGSK